MEETWCESRQGQQIFFSSKYALETVQEFYLMDAGHCVQGSRADAEWNYPLTSI
jgi:hypothetical protein